MIIAVIFGCFQEKSVHKYINGCTISKENPFQTTRNPGLMLFKVARSASLRLMIGCHCGGLTSRVELFNIE